MSGDEDAAGRNVFEMEKIVTPSSELAISHNVDVLFIGHINQVHLAVAPDSHLHVRPFTGLTWLCVVSSLCFYTDE